MSVPMFFSSGKKPVYGVFQRGFTTGYAGRAVLFCNALPQEATVAYRAVRLLADSLARVRVHSLRFDYYATGDSEGDSTELTIDGQLEDIAAAVEELKALCGAQEVYLVGMRFGALLALQAAVLRNDIAGIIAWEPVCNGAAYAGELRGQSEQVSAEVIDIGGMVLHQDYLSQLSQWTLGAYLPGAGARLRIIASAGNPEFGELQGMVEPDQPSPRVEIVDDPLPWVADSEVGVAPVPAGAIRLIQTWMAEWV